MSRCYSLQLPLDMIIPAADLANRGRLTLDIPIPDILDRGRMQELLARVLATRGWRPATAEITTGITTSLQQAPSPLLEKPGRAEKAVWRLDPQARTLSVDVSENLSDTVLISSVSPNRNHLTQDETTVAATKAREQLAAEEHALMEEALAARRALFADLGEVYRQALLEKAAALGTVLSVTESHENGHTRIRLEIAG
jgi:small-conductance mechanosensitive channel